MRARRVNPMYTMISHSYIKDIALSDKYTLSPSKLEYTTLSCPENQWKDESGKIEKIDVDSSGYVNVPQQHTAAEAKDNIHDDFRILGYD